MSEGQLRKNKDNARLQFKKWKLEEVAPGTTSAPWWRGQLGGGGGEDNLLVGVERTSTKTRIF